MLVAVMTTMGTTEHREINTLHWTHVAGRLTHYFSAAFIRKREDRRLSRSGKKARPSELESSLVLKYS